MYVDKYSNQYLDLLPQDMSELMFFENLAYMQRVQFVPNIRYQNIRYHCPGFGIFRFTKPIVHCYKRHIWYISTYQTLSVLS